MLDRLVRERLIDRGDNGYAIRRLGGLLVAKKLDKFPDLARKAPRVIVYNGASKLDTRIDQTGNRGYAVGFRGLHEFVNRVEISNPGEPIVPVERFIDGYQSRNERLADFMRRMNICEEKSSGIDRVVHEAEVFQLPAPDFRAGHRRTIVTVYGPRPFDEMDRDDRLRACYQHCALNWVVSKRMTNQSLRDRFRLPENKAAVTSQIIAATIEAGLVKPDETVGSSRKYARYLPFWA